MLHFKDQLSTAVYITAQHLTTSNSVIMVVLYDKSKTWQLLPISCSRQIRGIDCQTEQTADTMINDNSNHSTSFGDKSTDIIGRGKPSSFRKKRLSFQLWSLVPFFKNPFGTISTIGWMASWATRTFCLISALSRCAWLSKFKDFQVSVFPIFKYIQGLEFSRKKIRYFQLSRMCVWTPYVIKISTILTSAPCASAPHLQTSWRHTYKIVNLLTYYFQVFIQPADCSRLLHLVRVPKGLIHKNLCGWLVGDFYRKPNRGEGIISIKLRLKSIYNFLGLMCCLIVWYVCLVPGPMWYISYSYGTI